MSKKLFHIQNGGAGEPAHTYLLSQVSSGTAPFGRDGAWGFYINPYHYVAAGWTGGVTTVQDFRSSGNGGASWSALTAVPFTGRHTMATYNLDGVVYVVGGDVFNDTNDGSYATDSWKYDGSWTQQATDCGIGDRSLMGAAYHNGAFYIVGGQSDTLITDGLFNTTLKSTNNCVSFSSLGTHPFAGGNMWGSLVSFQGKLWKICGGKYDNDVSLRTYPLEIYSSPDGVTWTNEGNFPGVGRQYHQTIVWNKKIWVIGGYNNFSGNNLGDIWYSGDGVNWTQFTGFTGWDDRHAHTAWLGGDVDVYGDANGIYMFGGTKDTGSTTNEIWKITKVYP